MWRVWDVWDSYCQSERKFGSYQYLEIFFSEICLPKWLQSDELVGCVTLPTSKFYGIRWLGIFSDLVKTRTGCWYVHKYGRKRLETAVDVFYLLFQLLCKPCDLKWNKRCSSAAAINFVNTSSEISNNVWKLQESYRHLRVQGNQLLAQ